jgi:prolyl-tRNA synthetase
MRASKFLITTKKEIPSDAEVISHQLMLRAGMIRKLTSGLYTWLPIGLRVLRKVEAIIREEMDRSGAQEVLMPITQPAEIWKKSGRWKEYGPELLRIKDRHDRSFCLGPTHEEVITDLVGHEIQSYKQLPVTFYQIQTKFRDERRPRFGVMRSREFLMKDAYSFHASEESLRHTYELMHQTYTNIFKRIGLDFRSVIADTGSIGGNHSHEFHVLAASGEDAIAFSTKSDFAANIETTKAVNLEKKTSNNRQQLQKIEISHQHSTVGTNKLPDTDKVQTIKIIIVLAEPDIILSNDDQDISINPLAALILRDDHELNTVKSQKISGIKSPLTLASQEIIKKQFGCDISFLGPVGLNIPVIADHAASQLIDFTCGANKDGFYLTGVNWERDCPDVRVEDIRNAVQGDPSPDGRGVLDIKRGIEVGHIFQLGAKYSKTMNATVLNEEGKEQTMFMGCYGIGVSRIVAAAIEQNNDASGIVWPDALAPFQIALIPINMQKSEQVKIVCEKIHSELVGLGFDVLFMDQDKSRLGVMLSTVELIGLPHCIVVGERSLEQGVVEYRNRRYSENQNISLTDLNQFLLQNIKR